MQKILIIVAVSVFSFAILFSKKFPQNRIDEEVLSSSTDVNTTVTLAPSATSVPTPTPSVQATPTVVDNNSQPESDGVMFYLYSPSNIISSNSSGLVYESSDNADAITNWLKDRIKQSGKSVTSFVSTKTNGKVNNSLVGASGDAKVSIVVASEANSNLVKVEVSLEN